MFIQCCPSRRWCGQCRPLFSQGLEKTIVIQNFELNLYSNLRLINASHNGIEAQRLKMLDFHIGTRDSWKSREKRKQGDEDSQSRLLPPPGQVQSTQPQHHFLQSRHAFSSSIQIVQRARLGGNTSYSGG